MGGGPPGAAWTRRRASIFSVVLLSFSYWSVISSILIVLSIVFLIWVTAASILVVIWVTVAARFSPTVSSIWFTAASIVIAVASGSGC